MAAPNVFYTYMDCDHYAVGGVANLTKSDSLQLNMIGGPCPSCQREENWQMNRGYGQNPPASGPSTNMPIHESDAEQRASISVSSISTPPAFIPPSPPAMSPVPQPAHACTRPGLNAYGHGHTSETTGYFSPSSMSGDGRGTVFTPSSVLDSETSTIVPPRDSDVEILGVRPSENPASNGGTSRKRKSYSESDSAADWSTSSTRSDAEPVEVRKRQRSGGTHLSPAQQGVIPALGIHWQEVHRQGNRAVEFSKRTHHKPCHRISKKSSRRSKASSSEAGSPVWRARRGKIPSSQSKATFPFNAREEEEERYKLKFSRFLRDLVREFEPNVYENAGVHSFQDIDAENRFHHQKLREYAAAMSEANYRSKMMRRC